MQDPVTTRPSDLAGAPRADLLDALADHESLLVNARHQIGQPQPAARLQSAALDALATGQALADSALRWRWLTVVEALTYGATLGQVATAAGLDVDEVRAGARSWADGQHRHAGLSRAAHDEVLALLAQDER